MPTTIIIVTANPFDVKKIDTLKVFKKINLVVTPTQIKKGLKIKNICEKLTCIEVEIEENFERNGGPDDLLDIGRNNGQFGRKPEENAHPPRVVQPDEVPEISFGDRSHHEGHFLEEVEQNVREHDDPN